VEDGREWVFEEAQKKDDGLGLSEDQNNGAGARVTPGSPRSLALAAGNLGL